MTLKTVRRPLLVGLIACTAATLTVSAQSTGSVFEPELTSLVMESKIDPANIHVPAALGPSLAPLIGIVSSGLLEFRSRVDNFDPIARTARTTLYLAPAGSPSPAAASSLPALTDVTMVSQSVIRFESIVQTKGTWTAGGRFVNYLGGQLPVAPGTIFTTSFAYLWSDVVAGGTTSSGFGEFSFVIPGTFNVYSASSVGTAAFTVPTGVTDSASRSAR